MRQIIIIITKWLFSVRNFPHLRFFAPSVEWWAHSTANDMHLICISKRMTASINSIPQACVESSTLIVMILEFFNTIFFHRLHFCFFHRLEWKTFVFTKKIKMVEKKRQFNRLVCQMENYIIFEERTVETLFTCNILTWFHGIKMLSRWFVWEKSCARTTKPFNLRAPDISLVRWKKHWVVFNERHAERHSLKCVRHTRYSSIITQSSCIFEDNTTDTAYVMCATSTIKPDGRVLHIWYGWFRIA